MPESVTTARTKAWDDALLLLLYQRGPLGGEALLAAVIEEANDAMARLKESGMIGDDDEDD